MIIGIDGSRAFTSQRTGTENYSFQLLKSLAKIDRKNSYIVFVKQKAEGFPKNFHFKQINWPRLWTQGGLSLETFKQMLDVLFIPAHTLPLIIKPGLKTVVTVHDLGSEYLPDAHQLKQRMYLGLMQKYQLKTATKLIAVSKATKEDLINRIGINPHKITVVYEGFDRKLFELIDTKSNSLTPIPIKSGRIESGLKYFLFVGTVQPRKNLERVIIAFSHQLSAIRQETKKSDGRRLWAPEGEDDYSLLIAGSRGWLADEIYALPKQLGIADKVKFLGYVPDKDLPGLYSNAIALVFPSLFEGFGLPILEAQACGCPVITSNLSSMPEVAVPPAGPDPIGAGGGAILVDPYSVEAIKNAMIKVQGTSYREQLVKKGLENIKRFSWEKCAKETLAVLEEI